MLLKLIPILPAAIVLLGVAGCSSSAAPTAPTAAPPTAKTMSTSQPAAAGASVSIAQFKFSPATITVKAGQSITFTNNDSAAHTTTNSGTTGAWDSGSIAPGSSYTLKPPPAGTYQYHCAIHGSMQGTLVVQG